MTRRRPVLLSVSAAIACIAAALSGCGGSESNDTPDTAGVDVGDGAPPGDGSTDAGGDAPTPGDADSGAPVFTRVVTHRIAAAEDATCVITAAGTVQCWTVGAAPVLATALTGSIKTIAMGGGGTAPTVCGLFADGSVKCADVTGKASGLTSLVPMRAFTNLAAGTGSFTPAALLFDGTKTITRISGSKATPLTPLTKAVNGGATASGRVCGVDEGGALACTSIDGVYPDWTAPSTETYRDVATDGSSVCAVTTSGKVRCWDEKGAALTGFATDAAPFNIIQLASSGEGLADDPICALVDDGRPICADNFTAFRARSTTLPVTEHVVEMAVGGWVGGHLCGIRPDDTVVCWDCPSCNTVPAGLKAKPR